MIELEVLKLLAERKTHLPREARPDFRWNPVLWLEPRTPMEVVSQMAHYMHERAPNRNFMYVVTATINELIEFEPWFVASVDPVAEDDERVPLGYIGDLFAIPIISFEPKIPGRPRPGFNFYEYQFNPSST